MSRQQVPNRAIEADSARANLLTNGGFEIWQRSNGPFTATGMWCSDRWQLGIVGTDTLSISKNTANADIANGSINCASCTFVLGSGAGASGVYGNFSAIPDGQQLASRSLSLSMRVKSSVIGSVRLGIYTGATWIYSTTNLTTAYETLSISATMAASGGSLGMVAAYFSASATIYLDNAMLVVGSVPADYAPLHPADDLARCLRYYYRYVAPGGGYFIASGQATSSTTASCPFPLPINMGGTPVISYSAVGDFACMNAVGAAITTTSITLSSPVGNRPALQLVVASGLVAGNASIFESLNGGWLALEWNP